MKRFSLGIVFTLGIIAHSFSATASAKTLNESMSAIGSEMARCFPLILAQRELSVVEKTSISNCVEKLKTLFNEVEPYIRKKSETYQISYQFVTEHLKDTSEALKTADFDFIRYRLRTLGAICTSCHTQDKQLRTLFAGTTRQQFDNDNSFAEFNYLTRNYEQAEKYYDQFLRADAAMTELELIKPLHRIAIIYTQIYNRPGDGANVLEKYKDLKNHTGATRKSVAGWITGLRELENAGAGKLNKLDFQTLEGYVTKYLVTTEIMPAIIYSTPIEEMNRIWLRGQLFQYLNNQPRADEIAKILYWLSIIDRAIGYDFDFSLAEYYLKHCIYNHSQDPYAHRCYEEYKHYVTFFYSGVLETELPIEVDRELTRMRKALAPAKKPRNPL